VSGLAVRVQRWSLAAGIVALAVCGAALLFQRELVFQSYLVAWLFCLGIALGSTANLMVYHLTGGGWGALLQGPLQSASMSLPWLGLLGIPLLPGLPDLYAWALPGAADHSALIMQKSWYLNLPFFLIRALLYFSIWIALAVALDAASRRKNQSVQRLQRLCVVGLIAYAITVTFAAVDWIMSLTVQWYSTTFGLLIAIGQALAGFAAALSAAALMSRREPSALASPRVFQDLGNLLLMYVLTWTYLAFTQYLIVWAEDLPHEISWYLPRLHTSWHAVAWFLIVFHFALPFVILLFRAAKRDVRVMAALGGLMLCAHWVDVLWLVVPPFRPEGFRIEWTDVLATIGVGGIALAAAIRHARSTPVLSSLTVAQSEVGHG
jgi:hypothetical protein